MIAPTDAITVDPQLAVIIDDDARMRTFIATTLGQLGMKAASFEAAREAFAFIDGCHPAIIFLDVALLRSDAIDVLHGLRERRYGGAVQLMSGGRPALLDAIKRIGARDGIKVVAPLSKPFTREAIVGLVESLRAPAQSGG
jgi:DNA-binding NtrC family response regulator